MSEARHKAHTGKDEHKQRCVNYTGNDVQSDKLLCKIHQGKFFSSWLFTLLRMKHSRASPPSSQNTQAEHSTLVFIYYLVQGLLEVLRLYHTHNAPSSMPRSLAAAEVPGLEETTGHSAPHLSASTASAAPTSPLAWGLLSIFLQILMLQIPQCP